MDWFASAHEHLAKWKARQAASDATWRKEFNPGALRALELARKEADRLNRSYVGTEHILLGLTILSPESPDNLLRKLGLNLENVRSEVEKVAGVGREKLLANSLPFTPRAAKVLEDAKTDAKALGCSRVGPGHLLSALLQEGEGCTAAVFKGLSVNREEMRRRVLEEMKPVQVSGNDAPTKKPAA
jgi:ATP-dependent Clp protease ATP-binding subunit ClpC